MRNGEEMRMKKAALGLAGLAGCIAGVLAGTAAVNKVLLRREDSRLAPPGKMVEVNGHKMHVYGEGTRTKETYVFLSGGGTIAPVYDFRPLYRLLSPHCRCVVVEKAGYGYSEITKKSRRLDVMLEETRRALMLADEKGPYVLLPHSMSGLEAVFWAQKYPGEVKAIIGLDMAFPEAYEHMEKNGSGIGMMRLAAVLGIHRLPFFTLACDDGLTKEEFAQAKLLGYRNFMNKCIAAETEAVCGNAALAGKNELPDVPFLLFCSDGKEVADFWVDLQRKSAGRLGAKLIELPCGHYIHHFKAEEIAGEIRRFLE